jgi:hypothetical protein
MRRQKEIDGKACSHAEGQEVSGEHRFDLFFTRFGTMNSPVGRPRWLAKIVNLKDR